MKTLHRITTLAVSTSLALTPMLALADSNTHDQNSETHSGLLSGLFHRNDDKDIKASANASVSVGADASTSGKVYGEKGDRGNKEGKDGHMNQGANMQARADTGIDARVNALQKLSARLNAGAALTADEKASFLAMIQTQIDTLNALKVKIGNDTSTTTMRDDKGSIRPEFRTYALVLPRAAITAASDRILSVSSEMETVGGKLDTRISAAATAGVNVNAARTSYTDYVAKIADAKVQAHAAANLVVNLTPDNGDKAVFATNSAALKDAQSKLAAARADLKAARKDMSDILKAVKGTGVTATTTVSTH